MPLLWPKEKRMPPPATGTVCWIAPAQMGPLVGMGLPKKSLWRSASGMVKRSCSAPLPCVAAAHPSIRRKSSNIGATHWKASVSMVSWTLFANAAPLSLTSGPVTQFVIAEIAEAPVNDMPPAHIKSELTNTLWQEMVVSVSTSVQLTQRPPCIMPEVFLLCAMMQL